MRGPLKEVREEERKKGVEERRMNHKTRDRE